jgi:2'-5' RNA ligase
MPPKYALVYRVPEYVRLALSGAYERCLGRSLPVTTPHISFTFPFYLHEGYGEEWLGNVSSSLVFDEIGAWLSGVSSFSQHTKKILYIAVEPTPALYALNLQVSQAIRSAAHYDLSVYDGGVLPSFLPHLTLDYDFDGDGYTLGSLNHEKIEAFFDIKKLSVMKISGTTITFL